MGLECFPVPESAIPRIRVPAARLEQWKAAAEEEIARALTSPASWFNAFKDRTREGYELLEDRPKLSAFVRHIPESPDKDVLIRSTLEGVTLDELCYGLHCETTYELRALCAHMYEENFLDAGLLQLHEGATEDDPLRFAGMKWVAFRSPAPALMTSREFVYFNYEGTTHDVNGNRVLFRFLRSMPMDDIPVENGHLPPLIRGKVSNLHLYRQNGSHVDAFTKAMHSNAGHMPSWVVTKTISFMFPGILNLETACDARALVAVGMAKLNPMRVSPQHAGRLGGTTPQVTALVAPNACGVCFHKLKLTRAKRRCQSCCRVVCKRCTRQLWLFDELKHITDIGVVALRFCINCTRQARAEVREQTASNGNGSLRRSSMSSRRSLGSAGRFTRRSPSQEALMSSSKPQRSRSEPELEPLDLFEEGRVSGELSGDEDELAIARHIMQQYKEQLQGMSEADFQRFMADPPSSTSMSTRGAQQEQHKISSGYYHQSPSGHEAFGSTPKRQSRGSIGWSHMRTTRADGRQQQHHAPSSRGVPVHHQPQPAHRPVFYQDSQVMPLKLPARQTSAPTLHDLTPIPRPLPHASSSGQLIRVKSPQDARAADDLEAIFRLQSQLFAGNSQNDRT